MQRNDQLKRSGEGLRCQGGRTRGGVAMGEMGRKKRSDEGKGKERIRDEMDEMEERS